MVNEKTRVQYWINSKKSIWHLGILYGWCIVIIKRQFFCKKSNLLILKVFFICFWITVLYHHEILFIEGCWVIKKNKYYSTDLPLSPDFINTLQHIHICHITKKQYSEKKDVVYNWNIFLSILNSYFKKKDFSLKFPAKHSFGNRFCFW